MPPSDARVLFRDDAVVLSAWSKLLVTEMRGAVRRAHIPEIAKGYRSLLKLHPGGRVGPAV